MRKRGVLSDGLFGEFRLVVFDKGVGNVVVFFLEDQRFDGAEFAEFAPHVVFLDLSGEGGTDLLILEI